MNWCQVACRQVSRTLCNNASTGISTWCLRSHVKSKARCCQQNGTNTVQPKSAKKRFTRQVTPPERFQSSKARFMIFMARHRALTAACPAMYEMFCVWPKMSCWSGTAAILWPNPAHFSSRWHGRISFWGGDLSSHPNVALVPTVLCAKKCLTAPLKGAART